MFADPNPWLSIMSGSTVISFRETFPLLSSIQFLKSLVMSKLLDNRHLEWSLAKARTSLAPRYLSSKERTR